MGRMYFSFALRAKCLSEDERQDVNIMDAYLGSTIDNCFCPIFMHSAWRIWEANSAGAWTR